QVLEEIRNGSFAEAWIDENATGKKNFLARRQRERDLQLEKIGADLRSMMPFVKPKKLEEYDPQ
ncbi:MAG: ketol-acid reductoisomerase, partial [Anaerolineae bacterium]